MKPRHRSLTMKRILMVLLVLSIFFLIYVIYQSNEVVSIHRYFPKPRLKPHEFCQGFNSSLTMTPSPYFSSSWSSVLGLHGVRGGKHFEFFRKSPRVLIVPKTSYSSAFQSVSHLLDALRIKYKVSVAGKNLPDMIKISRNTAKYGVVFFEDIRSYLNMDSWNRELLDKYCHTFKVGIVAFVPGYEKEEETLRCKSGFQIGIRTKRKLRDITVNKSSRVPRIVKAGMTLQEELHENDWVTFSASHPTFVPVVTTKIVGTDHDQGVIVLQDSGLVDGIPKVLFGEKGGISHWLNKLLFIDAIHWLSNDLIRISLSRFVLVDIDDIFVGRSRMTSDDVDELLQSQERLSQMIPGFKYNLGFSGSYYHLDDATSAEKGGDDKLLENKDRFWWFPHMWKHLQPHKFNNFTELKERMKLNRQFAEKHKLPVSHHYSVAPHHSGVYPVHEFLYDAWKEVWDIRVTSTEEYPHLRPARFRRGFVHKEIKVLPRQTCGLFTKNLYYDEYPNGPEILEKSIRGGELFQTIVTNPVSVFMTHMPNYGFDRLAPYTFESVFSMLKCWTNLDIRTVDPEKLGELYFKLFPDEQTAIWGNPCNDRRHREIWSEFKSCRRLPNLLVIGPQKTGTTALYTFLQMHPSIKANYPSEKTFEELQFFSGEQYLKGIDWYMEYFPKNVTDGTILFEKSATYFDKDLVPLRAHSLLPKASLVSIIVSPIKRAYSWYHHMRAHNDETAINYSFHEVITAGSDASKSLRGLQSRCLEPGKYAQHLERWLTFYNSQKLLIVDGEELKYDPVSVMNRIQHFLDVSPFYDYKKRLRYDRIKGFYCQVTSRNKTKCLGKGKGRKYPPIKLESAQYLREYFRLYNEALVKLLKRLGYTIPDWLEDDLKDDTKEDINKNNIITNNKTINDVKPIVEDDDERDLD